MNLGYVISTFIASLVLLSLVALNSRIVRGSGEQTLYTMAKIQSDMIVDYFKDDVRAAGYGVDATAITIAESNRIQFIFQAEPQPNQRAIDWVFVNTPQISNRNPNVSPLYRRQAPGAADPGFIITDPLVESIGSGVVRFHLEYLDSNRNLIAMAEDEDEDGVAAVDPADLEFICQIRLQLIVESLDSYNLDRFERSTWSGEITPFNLNCSQAPATAP